MHDHGHAYDTVFRPSQECPPLTAEHRLDARRVHLSPPAAREQHDTPRTACTMHYALSAADYDLTFRRHMYRTPIAGDVFY